MLPLTKTRYHTGRQFLIIGDVVRQTLIGLFSLSYMTAVDLYVYPLNQLFLA